jgi:nucleoid-associated protein Lsr2
VAKKLKVIIVDDIDGTEGDGIVTHRFSLGSDFYEIDLCPQNLLSLRAALEPFVSAGRRVRIGNRRKPEPAPRPQNNSALDFSRQQRLAIRKWARDNGYDVADRRAFSQEVLARLPRSQRGSRDGAVMKKILAATAIGMNTIKKLVAGLAMAFAMLGGGSRPVRCDQSR